jgi:hypothetical protein
MWFIKIKERRPKGRNAEIWIRCRNRIQIGGDKRKKYGNLFSGELQLSA